MQKLTPLKISFCISILVHTMLFGTYELFEFSATKPALQPEVDYITLTLIAASDQPAVKVVARTQRVPLKKPPEKPLRKIIPVQPVRQSTLSEPQPAVSVPQPVQVAVVTKAAVPTVFYGDATSSAQPRQDTTTLLPPPNVEAKPDYLKNPAPVYPESARRRHQEGLVLLAVKVTAQGRAVRVEIKKSSGFSLLDAAAVAAVRQWEFQPGRLGVLALESQIEVPVRFELKRP